MSDPLAPAALPGNSIHIVLTFDDNFWAPAYAVMRSVCLFTHRRRDLVFHLFHSPLSAGHRADLEQITAEFGARLAWYELDSVPLFAEVVARMPKSDRWPAIVYARLLIDSLLPPEIDRVLYLDCDVMMRDAVEKLYDIDMEGYPLAAVRDTLGSFIAGGRDLAKKRDLFDLADPYFNSGVLLIDMERWRAIRMLERMEALIADGTMARLHYDQDLLNLVFSKNWLALDWRWNLISARRAHESYDPAILHYTSKLKPWFLISNVAYRRMYRHVMTNALFYQFMRHRWKRYWLRKIGR